MIIWFFDQRNKKCTHKHGRTECNFMYIDPLVGTHIIQQDELYVVGTHIIWWRQTIRGGDTLYSRGTDNLRWGHTIIFLWHAYTLNHFGFLQKISQQLLGPSEIIFLCILSWFTEHLRWWPNRVVKSVKEWRMKPNVHSHSRDEFAYEILEQPLETTTHPPDSWPCSYSSHPQESLVLCRGAWWLSRCTGPWTTPGGWGRIRWCLWRTSRCTWWSLLSVWSRTLGPVWYLFARNYKQGSPPCHSPGHSCTWCGWGPTRVSCRTGRISSRRWWSSSPSS